VAKRLDIQKLGKVVQARRDAAGLSVHAVAQQSGVADSTLLRLEQGKSPSLESYLAICEWLKVDATEFVVGYEPTHTDPLINRRAIDRASGSTARALAALAEAAEAIATDDGEDPTA
jgi:transcriptional regulator with XRE-family HTH domain